MTHQNLSEMRSATNALTFFPSLQKEMNRLFDQFSDGISGPSETSTSLIPALDVLETDTAIKITAEVPGIAEDDIDATIVGDMLTLRGEKSTDHEEKEENYHLVERKYGSFRRQIPLGFAPDEGAVEAKFSDGILTLTIAKPETAKVDVQKIEIKKS